MKKPMLLSNDKFDLEKLDYTNMYISIKRDGVRAEITNEGIKNRSFKILRNAKIQEYFKEVCDKIPNGFILEAEIYADGIPCREMAGICNSLNNDVPDGTKLYIFGIYHPSSTFEERLFDLSARYPELHVENKTHLVKQIPVLNSEQAQMFYGHCIDDGYEGAVLMDGNKQYKEGRVTIKQHIGFKMKPSKELDLEIIGVTERMENTNESQKNELGESFKRNTVDAKVGTDIAATFICKYKDTETKVTITGDEESRREIWKNKEDYVGDYVVVEAMDYGELNKLRHPRMIKIKHAVEK